MLLLYKKCFFFIFIKYFFLVPKNKQQIYNNKKAFGKISPLTFFRDFFIDSWLAASTGFYQITKQKINSSTCTALFGKVLQKIYEYDLKKKN